MQWRQKSPLRGDMGDLIIKAGLVVDGTGARAQRLDIRVRGGRITEMAPNLRSNGEKIIDAGGAIVAPGFIDSHTHFDATIYWDPMLDPMPQHGVTTVVIGNCSLGLAPMRPADRKSQVDAYSFIEDVPLELLNSAIPWRWESYGDYARALLEEKLGVNLVSFVGHSQIRTFVMGEDSWSRIATPAEIAAMVAELDRALAAGARGLSFSRYDQDRHGRPVPSCHADEAEVDALCAVLARYEACFQFVPGGSDTTDNLLAELAWVADRIRPYGVTGLYNITVHVDADPERSTRVIAYLETLRAEGLRLYAMASPRPFELSIGIKQTIAFLDAPAWNELVQALPERKREMLADAAWRTRARIDADASASLMFPFSHPRDLRIGAVGNPKNRQWIGRSFDNLIAAKGGHISDVLADWLLDNDCDATFTYAIANTNQDEVVKLLKSPVTFISGSDAGAHLQMFCAAGDATLLLARYVRDRGDMSIEAAIHALTGRQAELLGLADRGVLALGKAADITIFALDELTYGPEYSVNDVAGGYARLTRDPGGYRYTIANGEIVQINGTATGALPARWLRGQPQVAAP
jgi:N-acyl-D-amino-acid deacylase